MAKQYKVICGAVPLLHDRRIVEMGEVLSEDFFKDGEIGELIKGKFIEECPAEEGTTKSRKAKGEDV